MYSLGVTCRQPFASPGLTARPLSAMLSPPTPAPSPSPSSSSPCPPPPRVPLEEDPEEEPLVRDLHAQIINRLTPPSQLRLLRLLLASTPSLSLAPLLPLIQPRLQRDFLDSLPAELALHVLSFVDDPKTLTRAARVSKAWYALIDADQTWKRLCLHNGYPLPLRESAPSSSSFSLAELRDALDAEPRVDLTSRRTTTTQIVSSHRRHRPQPGNNNPPPSYKSHFKHAFQTSQSWLLGPGRLLSTQMSAADNGVVTSLAFDGEWIVVAMETSQVHVFEGEEGGYVRTLEGHQQSGVWCLSLVSKGGGAFDDDDDRGWGRGWGRGTNDPSADSGSSRRGVGGGGGMGIGAGGPTTTTTTAGKDPTTARRQQQQGSACSTARGWGQQGAVLVSGGCDRTVRVWDVSTG